ncbi:MBL fold metallo-hydrolase [Thermococci archaeon]|nr:MAG: MBL fold metallo-hydrolase [Thermococci archaeon]RLF90546.1 MAG: MBL fold metallo-hydrolase [Thermococci archaeon]
MKITWYGHSCFYIETRGIKLLFDPYPEVEDDLIGDVDYILVTHEHSDHYGKTPLIARLRDATVIGPKPVYLMAIADGITKVEEVEWGEEIELEGGVKVKVVYAEHPSSQYPVGYLIFGDKVLYHPGDTYSSPRFRELRKYKIDILLIPISGRSTANEREAADIVEALRPKMAIPMHYGIYSSADVESFKRELQKRRIWTLVREFKPEETLEV